MKGSGGSITAQRGRSGVNFIELLVIYDQEGGEGWELEGQISCKYLARILGSNKSQHPPSNVLKVKVVVVGILVLDLNGVNTTVIPF